MKSIFKKSAILILAQGLARMVGFLYTIFLARNLTVDEFGITSVSLAYFSLASVLADFGFNRFLIREVAVNKEKLSQVLFNVTALRLTFAAVLFCLFTISLYLFDPDKIRSNLSILAIMAILPQTVALSFDAVFIVLQKLRFSSIATLVLSLTSALLGYILVKANFGPTGVISALITAHLSYVIFLLILLKRENIKLFAHTNAKVLKSVIIGSLPYGLLGVMGLIYFKVDTLLLSYIRGNFETGLYAVSYKFLEAVVLVPSAVSAVLFPILAQLHQKELPQLKKFYFNSLKVMGILGLFIFAVYIIVLPIVINLFLPKYIPAVAVIQLLSLTIPFMFLHTSSTQLLLSSEKYLKPVLVLSAFTMLFNVVSNLLFIPIYGYLAAAWVTVFSESLSFVIFFIFIQKKVFKL